MALIDLATGEPATPRAAGAVLNLPNDACPIERADEIAAAETVVLQFPAFKDGRAYSQARLIRERLKFEGDVCAEGEILPDQIVFMRRCGFSMAVVGDAFLDAARAKLAEERLAYQAGRGDGATIIARRLAARAKERAA